MAGFPNPTPPDTFEKQIGVDVSTFPGATDTAKVLAAIASFGAITAGLSIDLWFQPKTWSLNVGVIGSTVTGAKVKFRGGNRDTTFFQAASATDPMFTIQGGPGSDSDDWEISGITLVLTADRPYDKPLVVVNQCRNGVFDANMACTGNASFTGTFLQTDGTYQSTFRGSWRSNKYAIPMEVLDHQIRPGGSIPPVIDTCKLSPVITGCFGVILRSAEDAGNVYRFDTYKTVSTNYYPLTQTMPEPVLASAAAIGDQVLHLVSSNLVVVGDAIEVDYESGDGHAEANKVTAVVGNDISLAQPLVYAHDPVSRGKDIPVIVGGWAAMVGDAWYAPDFDTCHLEGFNCGIGLGDVRGADVDDIYSSCGDAIRPYGNTRHIRVGIIFLRGRSDRNNPFIRPSYSIGTADNFWYIEGPFPVDAFAPIQSPTDYGQASTSRDWEISGNTDSGHMTRRFNHGSLNALARMLWGTVASGAAKWAIYGGGRGLFTDGLSGKYVAAAGKITLSDGDFTTVATDGIDGTAFDTNTGIAYKAIRANGAWTALTAPKAPTTFLASGNYTVPPDVTYVEIIAVGGGSGGGGGGSALTSGGVATQVGGGGGGAGASVTRTQLVIPGDVLAVTIGGGGAGGGGGNANSNPGVNGTNGTQSTVVGTGVNVIAQGSGVGGRLGAANSAVTANGGCSGGGSSSASGATSPGIGGAAPSTGAGSGAGPAAYAGGGGGGGGVANATNGGGGGGAGSLTTAGGAGGSHTSGTTAGANGSDAAANTGAGGGGGGGGAPGGAGGAGGAGGSGYAIIRPIV